MTGTLSTASLNRDLTRREQVLDELLSHYLEAQETLNSGTGEGSWGFEMPLVWSASYRELERTLRRMRTAGNLNPQTRRLYWHLGEWYLRCTRRQVERRRTVKKGRRVHTIVEGYQMQVRRHENVNPAYVLSAVEWVSSSFRGEPFVPEEIRREQGSMDELPNAKRPLSGPPR